MKEFVAELEEYFQNRLSDFALSADTLLGRIANPLAEGMRYATVDGGKRIRPLCVFLGASAVGDGCREELLAAASVLELIHSYSLVHDDLPAMDNDDIRRGKPSVHRAYGEANGILIGDALLTLAGEIALQGCVKYGAKFALATGDIMSSAMAMAAGQAIDLDGRQKDETEYQKMYALKTAALIKSGFVAGAIIAGCDEERLESIKKYGHYVGLCFQLSDDLLDGDANSILSASSAERVRAMLDECVERAITATKGLANSAMLADFAKKVATRQN